MSFLYWFIDPIKNHYFDFKGRTSRAAYWMFNLAYFVIAIGIAIVGDFFNTNIGNVAFMVVLALPALSIAVRRLHDTGLRGWWLILTLIPFIGILIAVVLLARKGQNEPNQYGVTA